MGGGVGEVRSVRLSRASLWVACAYALSPSHLAGGVASLLDELADAADVLGDVGHLG